MAAKSDHATVGIRWNTPFVQEALLGKFSLMWFPICYDINKIPKGVEMKTGPYQR